MIKLTEIVEAVKGLTKAINRLADEIQSAKALLNHPVFTEKEDSK